MGKAYLYLVRRNRKDTKIISVFGCSKHINPSKIDDISLLGLPEQKTQELRSVIDNHKMDWELWLESVDNYNLLKQSLLNRGIIAASSPNVPLLAIDFQEVPKSTLVKLSKNRIMTRRMN
jgi:hypothetical protein